MTSMAMAVDMAKEGRMAMDVAMAAMTRGGEQQWQQWRIWPERGGWPWLWPWTWPWQPWPERGEQPWWQQWIAAMDWRNKAVAATLKLMKHYAYLEMQI